jgi:glutathione-regulated potassium-efflux system ancillary protein KefG
MVLEFGWAYDSGGTALSGKVIFNAISTGGSPEACQSTGSNRFSIVTFLTPFNQTARLCKIHYLPPFMSRIPGTHKPSHEGLQNKTSEFSKLIQLLLESHLDVERRQNLVFLNQFVSPQNTLNP